ncbi:MAG: hypothetical protein ACE5H8_00995 [Alphaproteobacteria bacterium]
MAAEMGEARSRKGPIIRLFGVVLLFLGALDSMLSWRAGLAVEDFPVLLLGVGVFLCALGAIWGER